MHSSAFTPARGSLRLQHSPSCAPPEVLVTCDKGDSTRGAGQARGKPSRTICVWD